MSQMKYGEIFIIHNLDSIVINMYFLIGYYEQYVSDESAIIINFDDEDIHNTNDQSYDFRFRYNYQNTKLPSSFKTCTNHIYFKKYDTNNIIPSYFNGIYFRHQSINGKIVKIDKFRIFRLKSSMYSPIYHFVYDSSEFSKDHIIYIINTIFRRK